MELTWALNPQAHGKISPPGQAIFQDILCILALSTFFLKEDYRNYHIGIISLFLQNLSFKGLICPQVPMDNWMTEPRFKSLYMQSPKQNILQFIASFQLRDMKI